MLQNTFANISKPFANKKNTPSAKKNVFTKQKRSKKSSLPCFVKMISQKNPKVNTKTMTYKRKKTMSEKLPFRRN